jgi:hypothetical protein
LFHQDASREVNHRTRGSLRPESLDLLPLPRDQRLQPREGSVAGKFQRSPPFRDGRFWQLIL